MSEMGFPGDLQACPLTTKTYTAGYFKVTLDKLVR